MQGEGENRIITIPNMLTMLRLLLVPFFLITFYQYPEKRFYSMAIFAAASLTDGVDGFLARRLKQVTNFGKLIDPLADKLMILSMLFCLRYVGLLAPGRRYWLNTLILYMILAKEMFMVLGGMFMLKKGTVVHSNYVGKTATMLFCVAIILVFPSNGVIPWHGIEKLQIAGQWLMLVATAVSFAALTVYIIQSVKILKQN
ncbi:MAG: CDP-alcohol phosphatidyltransferase family protein [Clostridia bacterium]|nr:CDP-alcohol phosphatidyltransferase family protein [Clostridia bacterium]